MQGLCKGKKSVIIIKVIILNLNHRFLLMFFLLFLSLFLVILYLLMPQTDPLTYPTVEFHEAYSRLPNLTLNSSAYFGRERDIILESYRNPLHRDAVIAFFGEITGSLEVAELILTNASYFNVPPALAFSLCAEESSFHIRAFNRNTNGTVDRGLFQLNSASFPHLSVEEFYDPKINVRYGISYLRMCLDVGGTEVAALAMYNAGVTRVRSHGTPNHTLNHISRILRRERRIQEQFIAFYIQLNHEEIYEEPPRVPFRLGILYPLGWR